MKNVIKFVGKSIIRTVVTRIVKDLIAAYKFTEYAKREQSKEEQAFFRACNRIGMSDIQIYRLSQIMGRRNGEKIMGILPIKLLSENAILPTRANPTDSGLDLYVAEDTTIPAHSTVVVPTHIAIDLAYGYEAQMRPRSGNSLKTKLRVALGTIDHTYNKEIGIITDNIGDEAIVVKAGTRLAQLVVTPVMLPEPTEVQEFDEVSERGAYGSTGE